MKSAVYKVAIINTVPLNKPAITITAITFNVLNPYPLVTTSVNVNYQLKYSSFKHYVSHEVICLCPLAC